MHLHQKVGVLALLLASIAPPSWAQPQTGFLGTNLNGLSDFNRQWAFVDVFKMSRPWLDSTFNNPFPAGQIDADGWVTSLGAAPAHVAQALMFFDQSGRYPATPNCVASPSAANCYVLKFDGVGTITFGAGAAIVSTPGPGNRFFVNVPQQTSPNGGIILRLTATTPGNPVKNIRLIMAGFEATADAQPFHPVFLQTLAPYKLIRFMDWMGTNGSTIQNFSQWKTLASATQTVVEGPGGGEHGSGVAFEYMVDLCNTLAADMWITLPAEATDGFLTSAATLIRDRLDPGRKLYIEYSNEIWNGQFLQGIFIQQQGETLGLGTGFTAKLNYQARRSKEIFAIFETVFGGTTRLVRVLAGQAANADLVKQVAEFENSFLKADAIALAPYMDGGGRVGGLANLTSLNASQVLAQMQTDLVGTSNTNDHVKLWMDTHRNLIHGPGLFGSFPDGMVNDQGVPLRIVAYEGGQHLLALGPNNGNATANTLLDSVNRDAGMGTLYKQYFCQWRATTGSDSFVHFNDIFSYGQFGRWGALEFQDQDTSTSPKFLALQDYSNGGIDCAGLSFPSPPLISINDVSVAEGNAGNTNVTFTVSLSAPAPGPITVKAKTVAGTATAGSDFTMLTQTVSFSAGDTSKLVTVVATGDATVEGHETVFVNLSNPVGAPIADPHAVGKILNDDGASTLSIGDASASEGNSGSKVLSFTVTLSASSGQTVTAAFATTNNTATAGSDYVSASGTLTFTPGQTTRTIDVTLNGDTSAESNETFLVNLSLPSNATIADGQGIGTILNDDGAVSQTVCPVGCTQTRIQDAINASVPGGTVLVKSTYDSMAAGEVFPIQTLAINQAGAITITGETDGALNPITTVKTKSGPVNGFNIVSPGSVLKNLKIVPGDATRVDRVITASRNPGSCPGATCHLNGLTIQNVVIDFTVIGGTTTSHFNTGNAIELSADNVLIDKVTIKGIDGNSILVDGDNYTIKNSTLDGRDLANVIRGDLAVGFGADDKLSGAVCSGFPTNYLIDNNTIVGYADGIQWCSGRNNTVSNNTMTDISGKGVDTSGSQGTQIFGNVLQQNTTGATHGIGLSSNAFQTCTGNTVRNNKVLGRALRDMQRGITVQNCLETTIFQNELRDFADDGGAIFVSMAAGVATQTTIQGNTVIGGNAAGIVYFGADSGATAVDQSVIRDNVVNEFKRNGIIVQDIKGVRSGAGAGNVVAYNTVRAVNMGIFGDTHAFNLQNLANTAFDRNTALDTKGSGIGFFLANSTGVNGNCNTGSTNGGGLFAQVNVNPVYGNANVNCRVALYSHYDFDGDGKSDITMYRHTTGEWFTKNSGNGADIVLAFGAPGSDDIPAPGNYTVAGKTDRAIYRYTTGEWFIRRATDGGTTVIPFGSPLVGDVPMPADYDGDGLTDLAVFRVSTANAEWYIRRSSDGQTQYVAWGCAACADLGVPGDYDGDGKADVAVYRRSTGDWSIRKSTDTTLQQVPFGNVAQGDLPVPGRYTQTTKTDMAVYRSLTGDWLIRRSTDFGTTTVNFGSPSAGDFPIPADFTVGGITDIAVYRPTPPTAQFRIRRSTDFSTLIVPRGDPGSQDAPLTAR